MRTVMALMFMSLDGVAEFPIYEEEPAATDDDSEEPMWSPRMASIDTLVLGRRAYEAWSGYWPAQKTNPESSAFAKAFSEFADRAEKLVVSKTLKKTDWPNSRVVRGDIGEEIARVKALPGKDIALGGGPRVLQSFLERGLVDELLIEMFPSLLGRGKPFFHVVDDPENPGDFVPLGAPGRRDFKLIEARPLKDGTLFLHYRHAPAKTAGSVTAP
jgi:dihydrofolate reductase